MKVFDFLINIFINWKVNKINLKKKSNIILKTNNVFLKFHLSVIYIFSFFIFLFYMVGFKNYILH